MLRGVPEGGSDGAAAGAKGLTDRLSSGRRGEASSAGARCSGRDGSRPREPCHSSDGCHGSDGCGSDGSDAGGGALPGGGGALSSSSSANVIEMLAPPPPSCPGGGCEGC